MRVRLTVIAFRVFAHPDRRPSLRSDTFPHLHMRIGVPKETAAGEHRVALVPEVVSKLKAKGLDVVVQDGAGADALLPDAAFAEAGAQMTRRRRRGVGLLTWSSRSRRPTPRRSAALGSGSILIGFLAPLTSPQTTRALADASATAFAMEAIPRISRAQSMDALSSQSNVAGYKAALLGRRGDGALLSDADDRRRHDPARPRCSSSASASPGCRRSRPPSAWARARPATTCARRSPSRCSRSAPSGSTSASRPAARAATRAS